MTALPGGCNGTKYCFPCVNGLCPFGKDVRHCYTLLNEEQRKLFDELFELRAKIASKLKACPSTTCPGT